MQQLGLAGIGQQLMTLATWKKENQIFTHKSFLDDDLRWSAWDEIEDFHDFMSTYGPDCIARGNSEKEAILKFCEWNGIEPPFWW